MSLLNSKPSSVAASSEQSVGLCRSAKTGATVPPCKAMLTCSAMIGRLCASQCCTRGPVWHTLRRQTAVHRHLGQLRSDRQRMPAATVYFDAEHDPAEGSMKCTSAAKRSDFCRHRCRAAAPAQSSTEPAGAASAAEPPRKEPVAKRMDDSLHTYLLQHTREPQVGLPDAADASFARLPMYYCSRWLSKVSS